MTNCSRIGRRARASRISAICVGGGVVAGDDRRRIARREAQHEEDEDRDDRHHRDGGEQTAARNRASASAASRGTPRAPAAGRRPALHPGRDAPARRRRRRSGPSSRCSRTPATGAVTMPSTFWRSAAGLVPLAEEGCAVHWPAHLRAPRRSPSAWPDRSRGRTRRAASRSLVARPAEQRLVAAWRSEGGHADRVQDVGRHPGGQEGVPAALAGGSFLARRATSVCQSIACMSTLKPAPLDQRAWRPARGWSST